MPKPRPRIQRQPEVQRLRRQLADQVVKCPPKAWSTGTLRAMISVVDTQARLRESEIKLRETVPLRIVR